MRERNSVCYVLTSDWGELKSDSEDVITTITIEEQRSSSLT